MERCSHDKKHGLRSTNTRSFTLKILSSATQVQTVTSSEKSVADANGGLLSGLADAGQVCGFAPVRVYLRDEGVGWRRVVMEGALTWFADVLAGGR